MASRPLRVLHLTLASDAGGLSRYITDLGSAMAREGHEVAVAGDRGAWQGVFDDSPLTYVMIPLKGGLSGFRQSVRMMREWLVSHPVDVIHTHYRRATLLGRRLQGSGAERVPLLYTLHLSHISLRWPRRWLTDFGDHTHVASIDARDWTIEQAKVDAERVHHIPHGVDPVAYPLTTPEDRAEARQALGLGGDDVVGVFVGRLDDPKNCDWLVDLAGQTEPRVKFLLLGEGPHRGKLESMIASRGLGSRVMLKGERPPLQAYRSADVLLLPSQREGFSLVCAEAMCTGLPIIRTQTSGTTELVVQGQTGVSTEINREKFVETAAAVLSRPGQLAEMGRRAAELVRERFTFDQQVSATLDLYRQLARL